MCGHGSRAMTGGGRAGRARGGGAFYDELRNMAVPFGLVLAKEGLQRLSSGSKKKSSSSSSAKPKSARKTSARRRVAVGGDGDAGAGPVGDGMGMGVGAGAGPGMVGADQFGGMSADARNQYVSDQFRQLTGEIEAFLHGGAARKKKAAAKAKKPAAKKAKKSSAAKKKK